MIDNKTVKQAKEFFIQQHLLQEKQKSVTKEINEKCNKLRERIDNFIFSLIFISIIAGSCGVIPSLWISGPTVQDLLNTVTQHPILSILYFIGYSCLIAFFLVLSIENKIINIYYNSLIKQSGEDYKND